VDQTIKNVIELIWSIADDNKYSINDFLKYHSEILELRFISQFYNLKNNSELHFRINVLNSKYNIDMDSNYLGLRWNKFYSNDNSSPFSDDIKTQILTRDGGKCCYCGYSKNIEIHHVIPQKLNGSNSKYNLVCTCSKCNKEIGSNIILPKNWWTLHPESKNQCSIDIVANIF